MPRSARPLCALCGELLTRVRNRLIPPRSPRRTIRANATPSPCTPPGAPQVLADSDYPHQIGSLSRMKEAIDAVGLSPDEKAMVLGSNASALFHL